MPSPQDHGTQTSSGCPEAWASHAIGVPVKFREWLGKKLWGWSIRIYEDHYEVTVVDGNGERAATFGIYGQFAATWQAPYDLRFSYNGED